MQQVLLWQLRRCLNCLRQLRTSPRPSKLPLQRLLHYLLLQFQDLQSCLGHNALICGPARVDSAVGRRGGYENTEEGVVLELAAAAAALAALPAAAAAAELAPAKAPKSALMYLLCIGSICIYWILCGSSDLSNAQASDQAIFFQVRLSVG